MIFVRVNLYVISVDLILRSQFSSPTGYNSIGIYQPDLKNQQPRASGVGNCTPLLFQIFFSLVCSLELLFFFGLQFRATALFYEGLSYCSLVCSSKLHFFFGLQFGAIVLRYIVRSYFSSLVCSSELLLFFMKV